MTQAQKLYFQCLLWSGTAGVVMAGLVGLTEANHVYFGLDRWLEIIALAAYVGVACPFVLRTNVTALQRILVPLVTYFIYWFTIAIVLTGSKLLMGTSHDWLEPFCRYIFGMETARLSIGIYVSLPLVLLGPVWTIAVLRQVCGPKLPPVVQTLGCGQHTKVPPPLQLASEAEPTVFTVSESAQEEEKEQEEHTIEITRTQSVP